MTNTFKAGWSWSWKHHTVLMRVVVLPRLTSCLSLGFLFSLLDLHVFHLRRSIESGTHPHEKLQQFKLFTPWKLTQWKIDLLKMIEDVFPIEHGGFSNVMLVCRCEIISNLPKGSWFLLFIKVQVPCGRTCAKQASSGALGHEMFLHGIRWAPIFMAVPKRIG